MYIMYTAVLSLISRCMERIRNGFEAKEKRRRNGSELYFLSWPLIGKRDLHSLLFVLHLTCCKVTHIFFDHQIFFMNSSTENDYPLQLFEYLVFIQTVHP